MNMRIQFQSLHAAAIRAMVVGCVAMAALRADADAPRQWVAANLDDIVTVYQHFHAHPELSFQEEATAARLAEELKAVGAEVTCKVGGFGVVALIANGDGPTLMLRTDLDALPVTEQTGLGYASKVRVKNESGVEVGVMHACGHDIHIANMIGVARYMAAHKDQWCGTLMMIGQPAEERGAGARAMLEDGLFTRFPKPDFAVALHVHSSTATGVVGVLGGYALANVDSVDITCRGRGGHGAAPHSTVDPIVQAAQLVVNLQSIVSREVKPLEPAVVTVGSIHGGTKHNVIGDSCHLQITVRSYSDEVRRQVLDAIKRRARGVAIAANAPEPIVKISEGTPSLWNDRDLAARAKVVLAKALGKGNVAEAEQSMGGEDFSRYGKAGVPILMYRVGSVDRRRLDRFQQLEVPAPSLHSALYYPDAPETLATAMTSMIALSLDLLKPAD